MIRQRSEAIATAALAAGITYDEMEEVIRNVIDAAREDEREQQRLETLLLWAEHLALGNEDVKYLFVRGIAREFEWRSWDPEHPHHQHRARHWRYSG